MPFIIAGKNPSKRLIRKAGKNKNVSIVSNPSDTELDDLITKAQIHVLPSFNKTGIKLKLINALYNGRHCVVNDEAVEGSGLEDTCHIGTTSKAIASIITQLYHHPFGEEEINLRKRLLGKIFNNKANAQQLIRLIW
jgi:glycosyltransferase involved in cell wall biosynthesis